MRWYDYTILGVWMAGCFVKALRSYSRAIHRRAEQDAEHYTGGTSDADAIWFRGKKGQNWSQVIGFGLFGAVGVFELIFPDSQGFSDLPAILSIACFLFGITVIAWGDEYMAFCERKMLGIYRDANVDGETLTRIDDTTADTNRMMRESQDQRTGDRPEEKADREQTTPHREATERRMDEQDARMDEHEREDRRRKTEGG